MEENYILSVSGRQLVNGEYDKVELQTTAAYILKNGSKYITYKEYDAQNPEKHYRTTVKVDPNNTVTVMKGGDGTHHLILEQGKRHKCEYATAFGSLFLGVYTENVKINLNEHGGELHVKYSIDIESELASRNELTLKIKEANSDVNSI